MRNFSSAGFGYRATGPSFEAGRQLVPTVLASVATAHFNLFYLEIANNTGGDINVTVFDAEGLVLLPTQKVANGALLTYRSDFGTPMSGLAWIASAPGLVGWFCGAFTV